MKIKYIEGDLFSPLLNDKEPGAIVIPHVCNNQGAWGAGFVVPLGRNFPIVKQKYLQWADIDEINLSDPIFGLGSTQFVNVNDKIFVANMVAQTLGGNRPLYYNYLSKCMDEVASFTLKRTECRENEARIICPAFGAGLAGGNWPFIEQLIQDCWIKRNIQVTVYYLENTKPEGLINECSI